MSEHFIKEIEIKNYKLFKDFKASGFGRVNLIGGKNNVGKTAFMEACSINVYTKDIPTLLEIFRVLIHYRNRLEKEKDINIVERTKESLGKINKYYSKSNISFIDYKVLSNNGKKEYSFLLNKKTDTINSNLFSYETKPNPKVKYIDSYGYDNSTLKEVYEAIQLSDAENKLSEYIVNFDDNILNFKIIGGDKPQCKTNSGIYRDINEFGDGLKHWISIICSLYAVKDGYLFIDEIENGIHYTKMDMLWEIILTISKEQNIQVFATTHSKECIESFARVAKKLEDKEITYTILTKLSDDSIDAGVYDSDMFINTIEQEHEVRGW